MRSKYIYGIIIVIILLVLLFVYNMAKGTPIQNKNGSTTANTANTMSINYNQVWPYSLIVNVTGDKSFTGTFNNITSGFNTTGDAITATGFNPINFISFNNSYLNFIMDTNVVNNTPVSVYSIYLNPAYGISVSDSDTTHSLYNASSVTFSGNILTFTNNSNTLTITFGSVPKPNGLHINVSQDKTSLTLSVINDTTISTTINNLTNFTVSTAAQPIIGSVPVNFVTVSKGIVYFIMDPIIVNNTPVSYYSLNMSANNIGMSCSYGGVLFYSTSGVLTANKQMSFINGVVVLLLVFPNNFA